jgi:hypothetical protein
LLFQEAILIAVGTLLMTLMSRRDEIGLLAITTAIVLIVAAAGFSGRGNDRPEPRRGSGIVPIN